MKDKLIRSKIPEIVGKPELFSEIPPDELISYIKRKIVEEAQEVASSTDRSNLIEELGDLYSAMIYLIETESINVSDMRDVQVVKEFKSGKFTNVRMKLKDTEDA